MLETVFAPFALPYVQRAMLEILLLAVIAGVIGPWIVLRSLSFHSHAVGVSTFPGLVLADGLGFPAQALAFLAAGAFTFLTSALARIRNAATDAITALVLVGFLAAGVILASDVFGSGANVDSLLFGSLLSIGTMDLVFAAATALLAVGASTLFGRHWLSRGFDDERAPEAGSGSRWFDVALLATVSVAVIATLNAIGALLVIALLVVPAATVRLVARRLPGLRWGTLGLVSVEGLLGIWLSVRLNVPPGAAIAVLSGIIFGLVAGLRATLPGGGGRKAIAGIGAVAAAGLFTAGCTPGGEGDPEKVTAIATTTQIADVVREVGGSEVEVTQLLQPNTDPHEYEPRPSDVEAFPEAEVVFINGGHLDEWVWELVEDSGSDARIVDLGERVPVRLGKGTDDQEGEHAGGDHDHESEELDSHWWHDPTNVEAASRRVARVLGEVDPGAGRQFLANADRYGRELAALDNSITACIGQIPASDRKLVTDHEAFGYFANRYGIEVVGSVIPALTTQAEPSAGDLAELEKTIRAEGVAAVFPESSASNSTAEAIARDTGASAEYGLYGDALGPADSPGGTYIGMMETNAGKIALGLSGGKVTCDFG